MTLGANGQWDFVLPFRGGKLAVMLLVAYAVAVSSVLFQTVTHNRILTPAIMGFDALYLLKMCIRDSPDSGAAGRQAGQDLRRGPGPHRGAEQRQPDRCLLYTSRCV